MKRIGREECTERKMEGRKEGRSDAPKHPS